MCSSSAKVGTARDSLWTCRRSAERTVLASPKSSTTWSPWSGPTRFLSAGAGAQRAHSRRLRHQSAWSLTGTDSVSGLCRWPGLMTAKRARSMLCRTQNETARRSFDAGLPAALRSGMQSPVQIAIAVLPSLCVDAQRCTAAAHCARIDFTKTTLSALKWRAQPSLSCPAVRGASASGECVLGDGGSPWNETAWKSM